MKGDLRKCVSCPTIITVRNENHQFCDECSRQANAERSRQARAEQRYGPFVNPPRTPEQEHQYYLNKKAKKFGSKLG